MLMSKVKTRDSPILGKDQRKTDDVSDITCFAQLSLPILVIPFCFVELNDVSDCYKGIAK